MCTQGLGTTVPGEGKFQKIERESSSRKNVQTCVQPLAFGRRVANCGLGFGKRRRKRIVQCNSTFKFSNLKIKKYKSRAML